MNVFEVSPISAKKTLLEPPPLCLRKNSLGTTDLGKGTSSLVPRSSENTLRLHSSLKDQRFVSGLAFRRAVRDFCSMTPSGAEMTISSFRQTLQPPRRGIADPPQPR
jgi:hypothetical protein